MAANPAPAQFTDILCIGLGLSGICLGAQLKRKLDFTDIHFYDRNESHSGTWFVNRYPGCACDIPTIFYSFSFELNPNWSRPFPPNHEIRDYLDGVIEKYDLRPRMTFQTECESARYDSKRQVWSVCLLDLVTGRRHIHECRLLFSAVGVLVDPKDPDIPGREKFEGSIFHTARWKSEVNLKDKDVIMIGNGSSATQVVPNIISKTKTLTQFINTPHWLVEQDNTKFGPGLLWAFRNVPLFARSIRLLIFLVCEHEWYRNVFVMNESGARFRRAKEKTAIDYTLRSAPAKYHDILIPDYEFACKRRIFDTDGTYLKTLHAPNFRLTRDRILEFVPQGIRTATQTHPADVIVLATGFQSNNGLGSLRIQGCNGEWLSDHWKKTGGIGAYNSTAVHGYPNFFIIYGPNSFTGHTSVVLAIENMVNYALRISAPVIRGEATEIEISQVAEREYTRRVQAASVDKVWNTCSTWYVKNGWNSNMYPWSQSYFWWRSTFPTWNDWRYKYATTATTHTRCIGVRRSVLGVLFIASVIGGVASLKGSNRAAFAKFMSELIQNLKGWKLPGI